MRTRLLLLACLGALISVSTAGAYLHGTRGVGGDPFRNTSSQHATNVEPDSFAFGNTIVFASQVGRFTNGGGSDTFFATSTNGGETWTKGALPGLTQYTNGPYDRVSDPSVAYDPEHNVWLIQSLGLLSGTGVSMVVNRSTDGGLTWSNPVTVFEDTSTFLDKSWIVCDTWASSPHYGNCYSQWDDFGASNQMQMSTSTDGGLTWSAPASPSVPSGLGGQPVVQPNGTVVVPYTANYGSIRAFRSTDGGVTWSSAVLVASQQQHSVGGNLRDPPLPSAEVDSSGKVFVAWHDCQFRSGCAANDIVFSTSTDGVTWTAKTRVPIDPTNSNVDHFLPGIGVDPVGTPGRVGVVYYYYPVSNCGSSCQLHTGFISSGDSGATWGTPTTLAGPMDPLVWLPDTTQGRMVGDYFSTSFVNHEAHPVFARARSLVPPTNRFEQLLATAGIAVSLGAGPRKADRPRVKPTVRAQRVERTRTRDWVAKRPSLPTAN